VDESCDGDVLEPLPAYEDGVPVSPAPTGAGRRLGALLLSRRSRGSTTPEVQPCAPRSPRFSATFTRLTDLDPALLADLPNWWGRRADDARVRVTRQLVLEAPSIASSGTWRLRGSLRSPWLRRWIPVELELWPRLGAWTKVSLEPQRFVRPGRRYFRNGHRTLDALTARLTTELHDRN
jgi:hypothetical protein